MASFWRRIFEVRVDGHRLYGLGSVIEPRPLLIGTTWRCPSTWTSTGIGKGRPRGSSTASSGLTVL